MERSVDIEALRFLLEEQRVELIRQISTRARKVEREESDSDRSALAQRYVNQQRRSNARARVEYLYDKVEGAIKRMDDGVYGICLSCGQPIHPNRLHALPHTEMCIHCKEKREKNAIAN